MTGQTLLDTMELLDQELQLQSGESDVSRGLLALNIAQDHLESVLATYPGIKGDSAGTVVTVASTETTAFPTGLMRLDALYMLDSSGKPEYEMDPIGRTGGHAESRSWPINLLSPLSSPGKPDGYWTNGRLIYWDRTPDQEYTVRWYGLQAASDITAAGTFAYDDIVRLPICTFAVRLLKVGVDDAPGDIDTLAAATFEPVVSALTGFERTGASGLLYTRSHST